jgi:cephalosporin hydroxylase
MRDIRRPFVRKALFVLLVVVAAAGPVALYDRLIAKELLRRRQPPITVPQAVDVYHKAFYASTSFWQMSWLNIPTAQNPNDIWVTQELISRVKPDFIIETGTYHGASAVLCAMIQDQVNPRGRVITIDIKDFLDRKTLPPIAHKVDFIIGSSTDPKIVADVTKRVAGGRVMVLLDSDHRKPHVLAELRAYAPLVSIGSYVIVQDTNVNGHPVFPQFGPGPMEAVLEFIAHDHRFVVDRTQERLMFTMHPGGYLRRDP